jgi:signal transduction histidine kinase
MPAAIRSSWVTTTIVVPSALSSASSSRMPAPVALSRLPVGSSANTTAGRPTMARAMATRCRSPPDSCAGRWPSRLALAGPADELKELADTFDAMLARLDAAFASQRRFVANASHELRTPLTEMRTLIDVTMAKPTRSAAQLEALVVGVRAAVDKSEQLIEALLTLARSDRGLWAAEMVDLPTAVEDAADLLGPAAAARQVTIDTALCDARACGDRVLLERLVTNLLDNAVRYNVPGGWVRAATERRVGGVRLTVANSGPPIPPDRVPELLEPFRRLGERAGTGTGLGLGLSIVQSVVNAHGGRLAARARPGGGLEIDVTLPAAAGPRARTGQVPAGAGVQTT